MVTTFDWIVSIFIPSLIAKLDGYYLVAGVSFLGLTAAIFVIWFLFRRLL